MTPARVVLAAGLIVLAQVLDVAVLARWSLPGASPDLTLLVVVALALLGGSRVGACAGLCAGLLADLVPPATGLLGLTAVGYGLAGAVAGRWHRPGARSAVLPLVAAAAASLVSTCWRLLTALVAHGAAPGWAGSLLAGAAYAVVGAALVVPLVVVLDRVVEPDVPEVARW
ncbi:hypothetical protein GCM10025868_09780 [Angustibacter aerolatus]|uniref:Rod shape-determining protein MreD n=1 Tax=Angustibacter aerolatus TaxID=1162965 RepID=A0ABQ6JE75_9ACTN|nr:hypothetical protein GCM10025868_09780 [Angustibacter aerolatus]